jgi:hypothetical protein
MPKNYDEKKSFPVIVIKDCYGCVDENKILHDDLGIANCGTCLRNETIKDHYQAKDEYKKMSE